MRWPVAMLAVAQTVLWAAMFYSFPALVPAFRADLGWSLPQVMGAFTAALVASALIAPLSGLLIDRGHGPLSLPSAAALGGAGLLAASVAEGPTGFYAAWIVIGAAQGAALYEATFALLTRIHGAGARGPITAITLVAGFAGTLAFPAAAALADAGGWRLALRVAGVAALVMAPVVAAAARRIGPGEPDARAAPGAPRLLARPGFAALLATFLLLSLHAGAVIAHILPLLADRGVGQAAALFAASAIGPVQIAGRVALMLAGRGRGERWLARLAVGLVAAALPALALAGLGWPVLAAFVLLHGAGIGMLSILRPLVIRDVMGPRGFGRVSGLVSAAALLGFGAAPALGATLVSLGGYDLMLWGSAAALALAGGTLYLATRHVSGQGRTQ